MSTISSTTEELDNYSQFDSDENINNAINQSKVINTETPTNQWMRTLKRFLDVKKQDKSDYTPASLVVGFSAIAWGILDIFSSIRHTLGGQVKKLQNASLSKKKSDYLTMEEIKAILDSPATSVLTAKGITYFTWLWLLFLSSFRGGDASD
ncbi:5244_t:CDS:2 [Acaulospora morrowiae]|uniref:5244_t:CDS:1 n=1 Tax=Acaulospora morrowiae TaxID=94023 RepID=A0A9N9GME5_9GLOM|nr:5244_t:CDS:2 [Acaulospora morrowiae]